MKASRDKYSEILKYLAWTLVVIGIILILTGNTGGFGRKCVMTAMNISAFFCIFVEYILQKSDKKKSFFIGSNFFVNKCNRYVDLTVPR